MPASSTKSARTRHTSLRTWAPDSPTTWPPWMPQGFRCRLRARYSAARATRLSADPMSEAATSRQPVVKALHRLPHGIPVAVRVDLHRDVNVGMTRHRLHEVGWYSELQQQRHDRMVQI